MAMLFAPFICFGPVLPGHLDQGTVYINHIIHLRPLDVESNQSALQQLILSSKRDTVNCVLHSRGTSLRDFAAKTFQT